MKIKFTASLALLALALVPAQLASAHCQVPCGIYGDETRFTMMDEHITTIEKSINQINELSAAGDKNYNQLVRWVNNKETHADELTDIVTYYFLAQRIKADADQYEEKLKALHGIMVSAMKAKQTTDLAHIASLKEGVATFRTLYMGKEAQAHLQEEHGPNHKEKVKLSKATVEAGCATCTYKIAGVRGCKTAVKVAGTAYLMGGTPVNAHASGLCKKPRTAEVSGEVDGKLFVASAFEFNDK